MVALARADVALWRKEESIDEARRAMQMERISEDAVQGPDIAANAARVFAWANRPDLAFEQLTMVVKTPSALFGYGDYKTDPSWDPLRKDPRFDKLLTELAPRD